MLIGIIGAGNGGQAIAGYLSVRGHNVRLYNRTPSVLEYLRSQGGIRLVGAVDAFASMPPNAFTDSLSDLVGSSDVIVVATVANAHRSIAKDLALLLREGQIVVLCPGRTGGALEFRRILRDRNVTTRLVVAECQSLPFACRIEEPGVVRIIGIKDKIPIATLPSIDIKSAIGKLKTLFPSLVPAEDVLETSLENLGAVLHPAVTLLNAPTIERSVPFQFYRDMTPRLVGVLEALDAERLSIGKAYGKRLRSLEEWITFAYPATKGETLLEKMWANPAYDRIQAPSSLDTRYLHEDIPTGLVPLVNLAELAGVETPVMKAVVTLGNVLCNENFWATGRTLESMGIEGFDIAGLTRWLYSA